ncbi:unnamed protein product [Meloidogyne enterolobii]|uniref:Uncharacterized protein n=1 Tax=Meloidogyne enterolobii TaxID=390850 RepID=A0ACB0ZNX1_MELEN
MTFLKLLTQKSFNKIFNPYSPTIFQKAQIGGCACEEDVDYAFEMSSSTLRFGKGVTKEIGFDVVTFGAKNPLIVTDKNVAKTVAFENVANSLTKLGIAFEVFDEIKCEPSQQSLF